MDVQEGFLCPICMTDLGDVVQLQVHFEEKHSKEDQAFVQNLKELFGKAKKKILPGEEANSNSANSSLVENSFSIFNPSENEGDFDPVSGKSLRVREKFEGWKIRPHSNTAEFKAERRKRIERNKSSNQILIRLEKLLRNLPTDPLKRRSYEQSVVPWIPEDAVKLCPGCAKSFNKIARRKHHCRLCGGVMCNDCSNFMPFDDARAIVGLVEEDRSNFQSLTSPDNNGYYPDTTPETKSSSIFSDLIKRKGGNSVEVDLNNLVSGVLDAGVSKIEEQQKLRICNLCLEILLAHDKKKREDRMSAAGGSRPLLVQYYEKLHLHMNQGRTMSEEYQRKTASVWKGEEDFNLDEIKFLRVKLLKIAENVDMISKRIAAIDSEDLGLGIEDGVPPTPITDAQYRLQKRIRTAAVNFVKDTLVGLPAAPSEEEFERLKSRRKEEAKKKVDEEIRAARIAKLKLEQQQLHQQNQSPQMSQSNSQTNFQSSNGHSLLRVNQSVPVMNSAQELGGFIMKTGGLVASRFTSPNNLLKGSRTPTNPSSSIDHSSGLILSSAGLDDRVHSDDPMVQQIYNLRHYISEARRLGRMDEVAALEENLKDLQLEYQKVQSELEDNFETFKVMFHKSSPMKTPTTEDQRIEEDEEEKAEDVDEYDASGKNPFF